MMNNNVKTMRRVRHTHNKLAALTAATAAPEDEEGADGAAAGLFGSTTATTAKLSRLSPVPGYLAGDDDVLDEKIDECPWTIGRGRNGTTSRLGGIEVGQDNAMDCMQWSMDKVLEHSGFQGASKIARNVLADTASEYLLNIGRTLRFLVDRFGKTMNPEVSFLCVNHGTCISSHHPSGNHSTRIVREWSLEDPRPGKVYIRRRRALWITPG